MEFNRAAFVEKYSWAAGRTIAVGVSDEHPFIATLYKSARKHHLHFRQRQFQLAYMERFERTRRSILKKSIEMNDRHAISLRISAAISAHPFTGDKNKKRLSNGGVKRWIEGIDDSPIWGEEHRKGEHIYDPTQNQSVTALQIRG